MSVVRFLPALGLAATLSAALSAPLAAEPVSEMRQIAVSGTGEVAASPDLAMLTVGATTRAATAGKALAEVNRIVSDMLGRAKSLGIAERDLMTRNLSVNPVFDNRRQPGETPVPTAYQASNQIAIRVRDITQVGPVIDAMTASGANEMHSLQFGIAEEQKFEDEARRLAVADARRRAEIYAAAAGVSLGDVLVLEEQGSAPIRPMARLMSAEAKTAVATGELSISAQVRVIFALK